MEQSFKGRRRITPALAIALGIGAMWLSYEIKAPCTDQPWDGRQWTRLCASDILVVYSKAHLETHPAFPPASVEYPPLIVFFVAGAAAMSSSAHGFLVATSLGLGIAGLACILFLGRFARRRVWLFVLGPTFVLYAFQNWDLLALALALGALVAASRRRYLLAGVLAGLGGATKLFPLLFLPGIFLASRAESTRRSEQPRVVLGALGGLGLPNLVLYVASTKAWGYFWTFQARRFPNPETSWFMAFRHLKGDPFITGWWTHGYPPLVNLVSAASFIVLATVLILREARRSRPRMVTLSFALCLAFLLAAKVFSPQYMLWLLPFLVMLEVPWAIVAAFFFVDAMVLASVNSYFLSILRGWDWAARLDVLEVAVWTRYALLIFLLIRSARDTTEFEPRARARTVRTAGAPTRTVGLLMLTLFLACAACSGTPSSATRSGLVPSGVAAPTHAQPNIVVILADDQRWDTLDTMPTLQRALVRRGTTFTNAFVVNPLCCPARASILTGDYSHTTGVYTDGKRDGPKAFDPASTLATWLRDAGYRTALTGKYLNHFRGPAVPPGWDRWWSYSGPQSYYHYTIDANGRLARRGGKPRDYGTDAFAAKATGFIRSTPAGQSFFLYFAPYAPHAPGTPPPRHAHAFSRLPPYRPPSYDEANVSDKPRWVRQLPRISPGVASYIDRLRRRQLQAALAIDDAVGSIVRALRQTHQLHDTILVYTSDNGIAWGEHRWHNKLVAYEESIRVPLILRYDRLASPPRRADAIVGNIDIAPTLMDLAGLGTSRADGLSLAPILEGSATSVRHALLIEHEDQARAGGHKPGVPTYCAIRTSRWAYIRYITGERELYDLSSDPFELENLASRLRRSAVSRRLHATESRLCRPPPPVSHSERLRD